MATSLTKMQVLSIYKSLLRESEKFSAYNFRMYALRRTRDAFKENKSVQDSTRAEELVKEAKHNLETLKRQVLIGNMYKAEKLVLEHN